MNRKQRNLKKLASRRSMIEMLTGFIDSFMNRFLSSGSLFSNRSNYANMIQAAKLSMAVFKGKLTDDEVKKINAAVEFCQKRARQSKYGSIGFSRKMHKVWKVEARNRNLNSDGCESIGKSIEFDGCDIIITDPCYIEPERIFDPETHQVTRKDVGGTRSRDAIHSMESDTLYGDWSCSVFKLARTSNRRMKKHAVNIGSFCADGGMVMVAKLSDVLEYNPEFDYHVTKPWTTALIKNFKGRVTFKYVKKLDELQLVGEGSVNFVTTQTGF